MIQSLPKLRQQFFADNQSFPDFPDGDPRKHRPLSFEQQKKCAKAILKQWRSGENLALLKQHHPQFHRQESHQQKLVENLKLADSQLVVARQNGFASWAKLKHYIESLEQASKALQQGQPTALDADAKTLHIRCGHDVMYMLAIAGFSGDFLSFADPYIQGPVEKKATQEDFINQRADFIVTNNWREQEQAYKELNDDYQALEYGRDYQRICFWFEHDAYDVLVFLKLLHFFHATEKRAPVMQFICVDNYPGVERFNGIGQLPAETMRILWQQFQPLSETQFAFGQQCWEAYADSTPENLSRLITDTDSFPEVIPALQRHIRELPWLNDGLNLTERLTLQILSDKGTLSATTLFYHWYCCYYEPLVFMGDSSYWLILDDLSEVQTPAIIINKASKKKADWEVSLTDFGKQLLAGEAHWIEHNPYDRWFGGTHNHCEKAIWYWDDKSQVLVMR